ncbi:MAG: universal stress protein [Myxococcota bacterium]|jgi:nucleotide-binding universal stress UspA family protein
MFDRILLLTDLTEATRLAFRPIAAVAGAFGSRVTIFHAFRGSSELFYLEGEAARLRSLIDEADRERAMPQLESFRAELAGMGVDCEIMTRVGSTFDLAVDLILESKPDLCVIPTEGHHEFTGRVLGSTTARIIRDTDVPVLTVNEKFAERAESWSGFRRILHPIDFNGPFEEGLVAAEEFAIEFGGRVEVVHVVEPLQTQVLTTPEGDILLPKDIQYQIKSRLQARLSDAAHTLQRAPACWQLIEDNKPGSGVMSYADRNGVDLIVLPTIGRDSVRNTLLGSVAEHVIKNARCPVLTIRHGWSAREGKSAA